MSADCEVVGYASRQLADSVEPLDWRSCASSLSAESRRPCCPPREQLLRCHHGYEAAIQNLCARSILAEKTVLVRPFLIGTGDCGAHAGEHAGTSSGVDVSRPGPPLGGECSPRIRTGRACLRSTRCSAIRSNPNPLGSNARTILNRCTASLERVSRVCSW